MYIFELNRASDAVSILESVVEREKKPIRHIVLLARAYYMTGEYEKAIAMYEKAISLTGSAAIKSDAENNIKLIREALDNGK